MSYFAFSSWQRLTANVFKIDELMNDEYGTHSKKDGEEVINAKEERTYLMKIMIMIILFHKMKSFYDYMISLEKRNKTKFYYLKIILVIILIT